MTLNLEAETEAEANNYKAEVKILNPWFWSCHQYSQRMDATGDARQKLLARNRTATI